MSANAKERVEPKFCGNCGALMLGKECTDCAPYERIIKDCCDQREMLRQRAIDASHMLGEIHLKRRAAVRVAVLVN